MEFKISSLLIRSSWTEFREAGVPVISYSFPAESLPFTASTELTEGQKNAVKLALSSWSAVSGIRFVEVPNDGTIQFALDDLGGNLGLATFPASFFVPVFFSNSFNSNPKPGSIEFNVMVHEIGHAIGLDHPDDLPSSQNNSSFTVMSTQGSIVSSPQVYDIAAVQFLYGLANTNINVNFDNSTSTININGSVGNDVIYGDYNYKTNIDGGDGNDILYTNSDGHLIGGAGDDLLIPNLITNDTFIDGGSGNDTLDYSLNFGFGSIFAISNNGEVLQPLSFSPAISLASNIENLYVGFGDDQLFGNSLGNVLKAGQGNDIIYGQGGNDTLNGGAGNDILNGGAGNDAYFIDVSSDVIEADTDGIDTVNVLYSAGTYSLAADLENINLLGTANISGIGNAFNNAIIGNIGDNQIDGGNGDDLLRGGEGNDTLIGGVGNDTLRGGIGNDSLNGGVGNDILNGGAGNDAYFIDVSSDVIEADTDGIDTVNVLYAVGTYSLAADLENINLLGTANISGIGNAFNNTIIGNIGDNQIDGGNGDDLLRGGEGNDTLIGGVGNDTLRGGIGNDSLNGGIGNDIMNGGAGNDAYFIDVTSDVIEADVSGVDTVNVLYSAGTYSLAADLENINLLGTANIGGIGNAFNNTIIGNIGDNQIDGGNGDDLLLGGIGNDSLNGGIGNDILNGGAGNDAYFIDVTSDVIEADVSGVDTVNVLYSVGSYSLAADLENINLLGTANISGIGNAFNNTIIGNIGDNQIDGGNGDDLLRGGEGNDTLNGGDGNDTLGGGIGNDILNGGAGNDFLFGGADGGNDTLNGGIGNDIMNGGAGNDAYFIDVSSDVIEADVSGVDTVNVLYSVGSYSLAADLENINLLGTANISGIGNAFNNTIIGNIGDNQIDGGNGDDLLRGGEGNDTLNGGDGNDTLGGGIGNDILNGGAGNDFLFGGADGGNDTLNGGIGNDIMNGGAGNDAYFIDVSSDVIEADVSGVDTVNVLYSAGTYSLAADLENINLLGTANIDGIGNAFNNTIIGNIGDNQLRGGAGDDTLIGGVGNDTLRGGIGNDTVNGGIGNDILTGGLGVDTFVWNLADKGANGLPALDRITDFSLTDDSLDLRDLLTGESGANILNFLDITTSNAAGVTNTEIRISNTGGFAGGTFAAAAENQHITLAGVNLLAGTNEADLLVSLIAQNKMIIDV